MLMPAEISDSIDGINQFAKCTIIVNQWLRKAIVYQSSAKAQIANWMLVGLGNELFEVIKKIEMAINCNLSDIFSHIPNDIISLVQYCNKHSTC